MTAADRGDLATLIDTAHPLCEIETASGRTPCTAPAAWAVWFVDRAADERYDDALFACEAHHDALTAHRAQCFGCTADWRLDTETI